MFDIDSLTTALADDDKTYEHIRRFQIYVVRLAREVGVEDDATIEAIETAALVHDVGKFVVPKDILNKPGALTSSEFDIVKRHVEFGVDMLARLDLFAPALPIVLSHHENWDGTGYPRGLEGFQIPLGARILSVVDCFDALTSDRPHRSGVSANTALQVLLEGSGTKFDPAILETFAGICQRAGSTVEPAGAH
jgi:HD-GYP domain-containing protein (c-di-GMP phosphodiesterase class II)